MAQALEPGGVVDGETGHETLRDLRADTVEALESALDEARFGKVDTKDELRAGQSWEERQSEALAMTTYNHVECVCVVRTIGWRKVQTSSSTTIKVKRELLKVPRREMQAVAGRRPTLVFSAMPCLTLFPPPPSLFLEPVAAVIRHPINHGQLSESRHLPLGDSHLHLCLLCPVYRSCQGSQDHPQGMLPQPEHLACYQLLTHS